MAAWAGGEEPVELLASFAEESGYRTPKVDVRGVVLDAERLLLVREPESDGWCLPGGWATSARRRRTPSRRRSARKPASLSAPRDCSASST